MYVSNREQITTTRGLAPIRCVMLRDKTGAHRSFGLWRDFSNVPAVLQAKPGSTVLIFTSILYNPEQGYSTSRTRYIHLALTNIRIFRHLHQNRSKPATWSTSRNQNWTKIASNSGRSAWQITVSCVLNRVCIRLWTLSNFACQHWSIEL